MLYKVHRLHQGGRVLDVGCLLGGMGLWGDGRMGFCFLALIVVFVAMLRGTCGL